MERLASWWAYCTGLTSAALGSLTAQDVALYVGIATTVGTFVINWYYKALERRERRNVQLGQE